MNWYKIFCWFSLHDYVGEVIDGMTFLKCIHCGKLEPFDKEEAE